MTKISMALHYATKELIPVQRHAYDTTLSPHYVKRCGEMPFCEQFLEHST